METIRFLVRFTSFKWFRDKGDFNWPLSCIAVSLAMLIDECLVFCRCTSRYTIYLMHREYQQLIHENTLIINILSVLVSNIHIKVL